MMVPPAKNGALSTLFLLRGSSLGKIWPWLFLVGIWAVTVQVAKPYLHLEFIAFTPLPLTLIGAALSIFLGFRNNTCYDRFWEGRKLWGRVVNDSRTFARQVEGFVTARDAREGSQVRALQVQLIHRQIAWAHALRKHLRHQPRYGALGTLLAEGEAERLDASTNPPFAISRGTSHLLREAWRRGWIDTDHYARMEETLLRLTDHQGGCERIRATPQPLSYTILTHRIVGIYCAVLPLGLVDTVGLVQPLVTMLVAYAFLGLDAIGTEIEEPFGKEPNDLPLSAITNMIERNLREALGEPLPEALTPKRGVLR